MIFADRPFFYTPTGWKRGTITVSSNPGFNRVMLADGTILSVQPKNTGYVYQTRPSSSDGLFEQCKVVGDKLVYFVDSDPCVIAWVDVK